jgi:hypothetical protein
MTTHPTTPTPQKPVVSVVMVILIKKTEGLLFRRMNRRFARGNLDRSKSDLTRKWNPIQ